MKQIKLNICVILLISQLSSCSNYIAKVHDQMSSAQSQRPLRPDKRKKFDLYQPKSLSMPSSENLSNLPPHVKRQYQQMRKRYTANDLIDNSESGSLWIGNGQDGFLFSKNNFKKSGDIVVIQIQGNLKNEISSELARAFPKIEPKAAESDKEGDKGERSPAAAEAKPAPNPAEDSEKKQSDPEKIIDRLSSVVVEEVNKDHVLLRGRKDILFRKSKRTVEIQALVARRDITDDDTVLSTNLIETDVSILR